MVLKLLEQRGIFTVEHRRAGERLERDYRASMTNPARLVSRYEAMVRRLGIVRASAAGGIARRSSGPRRQAQQSGGRTHCRVLP
jgi:hypothetical protein